MLMNFLVVNCNVLHVQLSAFSKLMCKYAIPLSFFYLSFSSFRFFIKVHCCFSHFSNLPHCFLFLFLSISHHLLSFLSKFYNDMASILFSFIRYMFDEPSSYLDVKQRLKAAQAIRSLISSDKYD